MGTALLCPSFIQLRWARYGFAHPTLSLFPQRFYERIIIND
jgi:hypothetical protein